MEDVVTAQPAPTAHHPPTMVACPAIAAATTTPMVAPPTPPPAKKSSTTLSVDRAAFLLLRVKKAFKRKRQHRKEKQAQALNASLNNQQGRTNRGKVPPPLLRSRTLPAIIVPGIPVVSLHTDKSQFQWDDRFSTSRASTCSGNRWALLSRNATTSTTPTSAATAAWNNNNNNIHNNNNNTSSNFNNNNNKSSIKSLNLPQDDGSLVYRRKSSGSTPHGSAGAMVVTAPSSSGGADGASGSGSGSGSALQTPDASSATQYAPSGSTDDFECYAADGSVLLRIPAPHVVAARAYRLASKKRSTSIFGSGASSSSTTAYVSTGDAGNSRCSGGSTPTVESGCQIPGFGGCGSGGFSDQFSNAASNTISGFATGAVAGVYNSNNTMSTSSSSSTSTSNIALTRRLVKLLHQSGTSISSKSQQQQQQQLQHQQQQFQQQQYLQYDSGALAAFEDAPRRLSWESGTTVGVAPWTGRHASFNCEPQLRDVDNLSVREYKIAKIAYSLRRIYAKFLHKTKYAK